MGQFIRIESTKRIDLLTTRTKDSKLWFVNNKELEDIILGYLAKYQDLYGVIIYAFVIMGNHYHLEARCPRANRSQFMRSLNSIIAKVVRTHYVNVGEGGLWGRRYSNELLPRNADVEAKFFYCALQAVKSGLAKDLSRYPGYNSFNDAIEGKERQYDVIDWTAYNNAKRFNPKVDISRYTKSYTLKFSRLPGYEDLSREEYKEVMLRKLEARTAEILKERQEEGKGYLDEKTLRATPPGAVPLNTKKSTRHAKRPIVLTSCYQTKQECENEYFLTRAAHRESSIDYLNGNANAIFPSGTYKPPMFLVLEKE